MGILKCCEYLSHPFFKFKDSETPLEFLHLILQAFYTLFAPGFFCFVYLFAIILLPSVRPATFSGEVERMDSVGTIITNSKVQKWRLMILWPSQACDQDWNTITSLNAKLHFVLISSGDHLQISINLRDNVAHSHVLGIHFATWLIM